MKLIYRITQFVALFLWITVFHGCQGKQGDNHKNQLNINSTSNLNLAEKEIVIKWFGQSCFLIVTSKDSNLN